MVSELSALCRRLGDVRVALPKFPPRLLRPGDRLFELTQIEPKSHQAHAFIYELFQVAASKRPVVGMRSVLFKDAENIRDGRGVPRA